jgi:hypothetical protein
MKQQGFFVWRDGGPLMNEDQGAPWIKAKLKTHREITWVFPRAVYWGRPNDSGFRPADEAVLPYLGKTVWLQRRRNCCDEFYFEIKDTKGLIVLPNWIDHFESEGLVPPAEWERDRAEDERTDDIWLDRFEDRSFVIGDTVIIHG